MQSLNEHTVYCSLDLEFTGFDPDRDQILEIGFAFFKVSKKGLEVVETWSQVFKPSIEVHPKILGLTGISQEELDAAPEFADYREFLQDKLGSVTIVGHNPVMDIKFLEAYGIALSGNVVDTLELVQFILPTHHSYNLENLVHYFGITHEGEHAAHRALADAHSTIKVLQNLLCIYQQFSVKLKNELQELFARSSFTWIHLFDHEFETQEIKRNDSLQPEISSALLSPLQFEAGLVTIDREANEHEMRTALGLQSRITPTVLAVQDQNTVMRLWHEKLVHGMFKQEDIFSESAFASFLERASTHEELRFCLKVIVWLHTNWQNEVVLDLNISFFGGQFKRFIVGGVQIIPENKILCVDYATLQTLDVANYHLVICDIQNFEKFMSSGFGTRMSWGNTLYSLKSIYNPEQDFGVMEVKDEVIAALASTDLFFSLVFMLLSSAMPKQEYATLEEIFGNHEHIYRRLQTAAEHLQQKLQAIGQKYRSHELERSIAFLSSFFRIEKSRVKWITIDERNLSFHDQPIDISVGIQKVLQKYVSVIFTETLTGKRLLSYHVDRLGLHTEQTEFPKEFALTKLNIIINEKALDEEAIYDAMKTLALPAVIVFPNPAAIKTFYNNNYKAIKQSAALFAQGYSGGGNKMFRNFSIRENSILLVTAEFMAKQNYSIAAKSVLVTDFPALDPAHPYTAAVLSHWRNRYPDLLQLFSFAKVARALKKIKLHQLVTVILCNTTSKNIFVDKSY